MQAFHFSSYESPLANRAELDRHKEILPEAAFRQEYLAEFISKGGAVFDKITNAFENYRFPVLNDRLGAELIHIGIDWGRRKDRTAIAVVAKSGDCIRLIHFRLLKNMEYNQQIQVIQSICRLYPQAELIPESNSLGDPLISQLKEAVPNKITPFFTSHTSKQNLIETVATLFEKGELRLPCQPGGAVNAEIKDLYEELCSFEVVENRGGTFSYSAPSGKHDDSVIAFCLAVAGKVTKKGSGVLIGVKASGF